MVKINELPDTVTGLAADDVFPMFDASAGLTGQVSAQVLFDYANGDHSTFTDRAEAEAANVPAGVSTLSFPASGLDLRFRRDVTGTALTTADGAKWSPLQPFHLEHWGAVAGTGTDQSAAIQAAVTWCGTLGEFVKLSGLGGTYSISSTITVAKPIWLYMPFSADATTSNPAEDVTNKLAWLAAGGAAKMLVIKSATSGNRFRGGRFDVLLDGANVATHGIHASSVEYTVFGKVLTYRTVDYGTILDDGNSALLNNPIIEHMTHFCGANAAAHGASGLVIDGDTTGFFATQARVMRYIGERVDGDAFTLRGVDNCLIDNVHCFLRSGATPSGAPRDILIAKSVNYTSFHAQKNTFVQIGRGVVYVEDNTAGNRCLAMNGEATGVEFESASGTAGRGTFTYTVVDRNSGAAYHSNTSYPIAADLTVPIASFVATAGTPAITSAGGFAFPALFFAGGSTETAAWTLDARLDDGDVIGIEIVAVQAGAGGTGDAVWRVELASRAHGSAAGSAEMTEDFVHSMTGTANAIAKETFTFATPLSFTRGDTIILALSRIGGDAADTYVNDVGVARAHLIYRADGPDAPGSGPYEASDWEIS